MENSGALVFSNTRYLLKSVSFTGPGSISGKGGYYYCTSILPSGDVVRLDNRATTSDLASTARSACCAAYERLDERKERSDNGVTNKYTNNDSPSGSEVAGIAIDKEPVIEGGVQKKCTKKK